MGFCCSLLVVCVSLVSSLEQSSRSKKNHDATVKSLVSIADGIENQDSTSDQQNQKPPDTDSVTADVREGDITNAPVKDTPMNDVTPVGGSIPAIGNPHGHPGTPVDVISLSSISGDIKHAPSVTGEQPSDSDLVSTATSTDQLTKVDAEVHDSKASSDVDSSDVLNERHSLKESGATQSDTDIRLGINEEPQSSPAVKEVVQNTSLEQVTQDSSSEQKNATQDTHVVPPDGLQDDMPSFDEWKQKEQAKSKTQEDAVQTTSILSKAKTAVGKKSVNYASAKCGAKIVSNNPEAQNAIFVLMENKDMYMINPCSARKVFLVELCDPVQIQTIEIGNLELFSSTPETIEVNISDRYPTKEWQPLATFHARDERAVQSFPVADSAMFAKYIRIEILSHYGTEHYCPLSILRVYGLALDDDDDEEHSIEQQDVVDEETWTAEATASDHAPNLFASATDTVLSLVKTVLTHKTDKTENSAASVKVDSISTDGEQVVATVDKKAESLDASDKIAEDLQDKSSVKVVGNIVENEQSLDSTQSKERAYWDADSVQPTVQPEAMKIVTLIESPGTPLSEVLDLCRYCLNGRNDSCQYGICGYYQLTRLVRPSSCLDAVLSSLSNPVDISESKDALCDTIASFVNEIPLNLSPESVGEKALLASDKNLSQVTKPVPLVTNESEGGDNNGRKADDQGYLLDQVQLEEPEPAVVPPNIAIGNSAMLSSSASSSTAGGSSSAASSGSSATSSVKKVVRPVDVPLMKHEVPVGDDESVGELDEISYQKLNRAGKETLYGKLKNRIRSLEVNLNLTNRYLEELSKRYKRQMEDMYSSLNRTITKLSKTAKVAEEKDNLQLERIIALESRMENITLIVTTIADRMETVNKQVMERHVYLMVIQMAVFLIVMAYFSNRLPVSSNLLSAHATKPMNVDSSTMPRLAVEDVTTSSSCTTSSITKRPSSNEKSHRRRRSDHLYLRHDKPVQFLSAADTSLVRSGSESDLTAIEQNIPIFLTKTTDCLSSGFDQNNGMDLNKRQRKKKKAQAKAGWHGGAYSTDQLHSLTGPLQRSNQSVHSAAADSSASRYDPVICDRQTQVRPLYVEDLARGGGGGTFQNSFNVNSWNNCAEADNRKIAKAVIRPSALSSDEISRCFAKPSAPFVACKSFAGRDSYAEDSRCNYDSSRSVVKIAASGSSVPVCL